MKAEAKILQRDLKVALAIMLFLSLVVLGLFGYLSFYNYLDIDDFNFLNFSKEKAFLSSLWEGYSVFSGRYFCVLVSTVISRFGYEVTRHITQLTPLLGILLLWVASYLVLTLTLRATRFWMFAFSTIITAFALARSIEVDEYIQWTDSFFVYLIGLFSAIVLLFLLWKNPILKNGWRGFTQFVLLTLLAHAAIGSSELFFVLIVCTALLQIEHRVKSLREWKFYFLPVTVILNTTAGFLAVSFSPGWDWRLGNSNRPMLDKFIDLFSNIVPLVRGFYGSLKYFFLHPSTIAFCLLFLLFLLTHPSASHKIKNLSLKVMIRIHFVVLLWVLSTLFMISYGYGSHYPPRPANVTVYIFFLLLIFDLVYLSQFIRITPHVAWRVVIGAVLLAFLSFPSRSQFGLAVRDLALLPAYKKAMDAHYAIFADPSYRGQDVVLPPLPKQMPRTLFTDYYRKADPQNAFNRQLAKYFDYRSVRVQDGDPGLHGDTKLQ